MAGEEENVQTQPTETPQEQQQETTAAATPEGAATGEASQEQDDAGNAAETTAAEDVPVQTQDWRDKELKRKHAQIKERERQIAEYEKRIADLEALAQRAAQSPADGAAPAVDLTRPQPTPPRLTQDQIQAEARKLFEQQQYQDNLLRINSAGETTYKDQWAKALENLATFGEFENGTMQSIMATDAPEKVLYELGKNPAEYQRIMELPVPRRHTEFVKLSLKQEAPKPKPSNAPAPTEPVHGHVMPSNELSDKDDDETWYKKRALQREARRKARMGV